MLLLDLTHTSHTPARTGVQRVARSLLTALTAETAVLPVTHDRFRGGWRRLAAWERRNLELARPGSRRRAHWPWHARWGGRLARLAGRRLPPLPPADEGVILPEIFSPQVAAALTELSAGGGPTVALFHDAIALRLPEFTPRGTVARFPAYLLELARCDGIAAVSQDSREALVEYWAWLGLAHPPPVEVLPLGLDPVVRPDPAAVSAPAPATILCVGSIEGRKNHLALLDACEQLWSAGHRFQLRLVGLARPETAAPALARIRELQRRGRPLRYDGAVDEATLQQAYATCAFTVYPSLMEGFGLPVLESLQHGRPCVCSADGALGESARGGGCRALAALDAGALAEAIGGLLTAPAELARLQREAAGRQFRTWSDYATDLRGFLARLRPRAGRRPVTA